MNTIEKNILLIINASEGILQIVLGEKTSKGTIKLLVNQEWDCPKDSTEKLTPLIKQIFSQLGLALSSIYKIASVTGAGSFTGIRLSLCSSAALSRALDAQQCSIDFLTALSYNASTTKGTITRVITHAKKDLVHVADFLFEEDNKAVQLEATRILSPTQVLEELTSNDNKVHFLLGSGLTKHEELFMQAKDRTKTSFLSSYTNSLNPQVLLKLAFENNCNLRYLDAEYVRSCDAVDNLAHISKKLGNDVDSSFKLYDELTK